MIHSIGAIIILRGNVVRSGLARPETVLRYLARLRDVTHYEVRYWQNGLPQRMSAIAFQARFSTPATV
jgi:hypothetical protein